MRTAIRAETVQTGNLRSLLPDEPSPFKILSPTAGEKVRRGEEIRVAWEILLPYTAIAIPSVVLLLMRTMDGKERAVGDTLLLKDGGGECLLPIPPDAEKGSYFIRICSSSNLSLSSQSPEFEILV